MVYTLSTNQITQNQIPLEKSSLQDKLHYPPFADQVHGLSLALLAKSLKVKIFWWLVFFGCTFCGMLTIMSVIFEYVKNPSATSITIKLVPSLELPAITICPKIPDALNFDPLFDNIKTRLPNINNETARDLISFWLAGSGLMSIGPAFHFNETRIDELNEMFQVWSSGYDTETFFHKIQNEYGYKCEQMFKFCAFGVKQRDCCKELFRQIWVLKFGLCYQTKRNLNQTENDGIGWFFLLFKPPPSITRSEFYQQPSLVVYVNDNFEHVVHSPRYYLLPNNDNTLHLNARLTELQEHPQDCTTKVVGKDAPCFVKKWLKTHLLKPLNCTLPYIKVTGISNETKICNPLTLVQHYYDNIEKDISLKETRCIPGCTKWEYDREFETRSYKKDSSANYQFQLDVGFDELQYEHVREISTISISGLISQVGGQLGLYLGLSIITLFQICIYIVNVIVNSLYRFVKPLPVRPEINQNRRFNEDIGTYV